ncbi:hypothetical protein DRQ50_03460 [bacterium]|nr:MAG: hypothetical protein DRQ50_03460 [bacterium]
MDKAYARYVIMLEPAPGADKRTKELIRAHVSYLKELDLQGTLVLAGPFVDRAGGMLIIRADSMDEARTIADRDPFVTAGDSVAEVRGWLLSCAGNNHLGMG